jgi:DNA polymerase III epsilon subunit-like protein
MSTAEIIAGHNVDGFDVKKCNTVFLRHGLPFIVGKKTIDTLKMARTKLSLEGNGLDYISRLLGFDGKDKITRDDWRVATAGDSKTIKRIETYCRGDVLHGKQVLETFLPLANKKYNFGAIKKIPNQPTEEK